MTFSFGDIVSGIAQSIGDVFAVTWWFFVPIILFLVFLAAWLFYVRKKNLESIKVICPNNHSNVILLKLS